ncbi:hypothetical protein NQ318_007803 [Aromia moschata]|uniref:SLC26A/SulP transporter domain-containing protein n=1 Tax=Aromia moschata TaxID=1265417 RepID=A0AAV8YZV6_9CUCU|nr:hypothetical protein NQ318_007803 [Aromia moschata]
MMGELVDAALLKFLLVLKNQCETSEITIKNIIVKTVPALEWISAYNWKSNVFFGYNIRSYSCHNAHSTRNGIWPFRNVSPVVGIYMAFFPVIAIRFLWNIKTLNSMGTFAVVCLMTGKAVLEYSDASYFQTETHIDNSTENIYIQTGYSPMQVATAVTFTVAVFQLAMCCLRLGIISALLSETFVSGFTTGAAIHVLTSQIKDLFGLKIQRFKGYFVVWNTIKEIVFEIGNLNLAAVIISAVTISISVFNNECIKPLVSRKSVIPVPIELIAVILGTIVSKYCGLPEHYDIAVVGEIPKGLPEPVIPQFSLIRSVIIDGFTIAIVSYTVTLSMALIFAQKLDYEVDPNQELLAMGIGNVVGSFFSCMPFCASLSRSLIQQVVGGKTQLTSIVSCSILVILLLWIGPFFEPLPRSVLASVIVVALKGMLMQITAVWKFWKLSKMDAIVWITTFLTVVLVSIDIGLLVGVLMSLVTIFILGFKPYTCLLGSVPQTDIYLDITRYKRTNQIEGIKIFHYCGGINFATRNIFRENLFALLELDPQKEIIYRSKLAQYISKDEDVEGKSKTNKSKILKLQQRVNTKLRCLILDFFFSQLYRSFWSFHVKKCDG